MVWSKGTRGRSRTAAGRGLSPRKQIYTPILSSPLSLCGLVALTICSSPLLRDGLSLRIVQAALAVLYMALKDIWKYLGGLWVIREEGWVWPTFTAQRLQGGTCFQVLRIQLTFLLLKAACFCFLSRPSPPIPPTWRAPACPHLSFELPGTPGQSVWAAGPLCRCEGCRLSSWRGR